MNNARDCNYARVSKNEQGENIFTDIFQFVFFCSVHAASLDIRELNQGWQLFKLKKYLRAAQYWENKSLALLNVKRDEKQLRLAALAQILSTIAYEKYGDIRAYKSWAASQTYLLESNIRLRAFQNNIKKSYDEELNFLNQASTGQLKIGVTLLENESQQNSLLLIELERALSLSDYEGPAPGLQDVQAGLVNDDSDKPLPKRSYIARPVLSADNGLGDSVNVISRGVINEADDKSSGTSVNPVDENPGSAATVITSPVTSQALSLPDSASQAQADITLGNKSPLNQKNSHFIGLRGLVIANVEGKSQNQLLAEKAWQYFDHNVNNDTGLAYDIHDYPYSTMWGLGSYLAALVSAQKLGVIATEEFAAKLELVLDSLNSMPLYNQEVPNRQYKVDTLSLMDLNNEISALGAGWSSIGIGRLLIWLKIIENWYPDFQQGIHRFVNRLDFSRLLKNNELNGAFYDGFEETVFNEGRFGYEQYAAMGYKLWGHSVDKAFNYDTVIFKSLYDNEVPIDRRTGAYLVSDPFLLASMEFSLLDEGFVDYTQKIYQVQKKHSLEIKRPVARTEINLHRTPWFVYLTIADNEESWRVVAHDGNSYPKYSGYSTHGIFMFNAVFSDAYAKKLMKETAQLASDDFGYYAGKLYSGDIIRSLSSHSNGVILESLLFAQLNEPFLNQEIKVGKQ